MFGRGIATAKNIKRMEGMLNKCIPTEYDFVT